MPELTILSTVFNVFIWKLFSTSKLNQKIGKLDETTFFIYFTLNIVSNISYFSMELPFSIYHKIDMICTAASTCLYKNNILLLLWPWRHQKTLGFTKLQLSIVNECNCFKHQCLLTLLSCAVGRERPLVTSMIRLLQWHPSSASFIRLYNVDPIIVWTSSSYLILSSFTLSHTKHVWFF